MKLRYVYGISVFFMHGISLAVQQTNEITKIYYHAGIITDHIVCYFSHDPICNQLPQKPANKKNTQVTFFLPKTAIVSSEAKEMLKKVQTSKMAHYSIIFNEVKTPIKGIKIVINYDPQFIGYEYQLFNAITGNKGIVFSLHNKNLLNKIKLSTDPIAQYAMNIPKDKKPKIMLDLGHGGLDEGKVGCLNIQEKEINLQVGKKVARLLDKNGCEVFLTRSDDSFIALDERTSLANKKKVDLFLSIHANSGSKNASGIETYWLDNSLLKQMGPLPPYTICQLRTMRNTLSSLFAQSVHNEVIAAAQKVYKVNDRTVKTSVAQVLLGIDMLVPAALIEIGFLSNLQETKLLIDEKYQMILAQAIVQGIINYLKQCLV